MEKIIRRFKLGERSLLGEGPRGESGRCQERLRVEEGALESREKGGEVGDSVHRA